MELMAKLKAVFVQVQLTVLSWLHHSSMALKLQLFAMRAHHPTRQLQMLLPPRRKALRSYLPTIKATLARMLLKQSDIRHRKLAA